MWRYRQPVGRTARWRDEDFDDLMARFRRLINYRPRPRDRPVIEDPDPTETEVLNVNSLDLNVSANCKLHHTDEYDITDPLQNDENKSLLVIRRGQPFKIAVEFNRPYDRTKDELKLTFEFGKRPIATRGSHVEFVLSEKDEPKEWGALIKSKEGSSLWLEVMTPPTALVGKWKLNVDVVKRDESGVTLYRYAHSDELYLLFNPWCKDDPVHMAEEDLRKEYVLNETGKIYSGSQKRISPKPWNFGQFTGNVLDCSMYLMEMSNMADNRRGDPIQVTRKLSALVNSADDRGVLTGNWSGEYAGGKSPLSWAGSVEILEEYYKTKQPVKFGQCWVFSGVLTTVCRALGIPTRSVTNFASAHDTESSITIDVHFDADGKPLDMYNDDSVWNFHVWNEAWMARPDLPSGYGGWQAIDSTPQETSDYVFCMGPMSVRAIKQGEVNLPYDGKFVFAEVNADKIYWQRNANGAFENVYNDTASVGKFLSTKKVHGRASWEEYDRYGWDDDREDVTDKYKFQEYSEEERAAVMRANMHALKPTRIARPDAYEQGPKDVKFGVEFNDNTMFGDEVKILFTMTNTSSSERRVDGRISMSSMYYTGVHYKDVAHIEINNKLLEPAGRADVELVVPAESYLGKIMDHCIFRVSSVCLVKETMQHFVEMTEVRLRKPHLTIKAPKNGNVGEKIRVEVTFVNTLPVTLTKCELRVEGPGLHSPTVYKQRNVGAHDRFVGEFDLTPKKRGEREIIVYFNSDQIQSVTGSSVIVVE